RRRGNGGGRGLPHPGIGRGPGRRRLFLHRYEGSGRRASFLHPLPVLISGPKEGPRMTGLPARPRPGARLASWLLVAGLAGGVPPKAYGATTDLPFGPLPWRVGGDVGFTVDA